MQRTRAVRDADAAVPSAADAAASRATTASPVRDVLVMKTAADEDMAIATPATPGHSVAADCAAAEPEAWRSQRPARSGRPRHGARLHPCSCLAKTGWTDEVGLGS